MIWSILIIGGNHQSQLSLMFTQNQHPDQSLQHLEVRYKTGHHICLNLGWVKHEIGLKLWKQDWANSLHGTLEHD